MRMSAPGQRTLKRELRKIIPAALDDAFSARCGIRRNSFPARQYRLAPGPDIEERSRVDEQIHEGRADYSAS
jgi:hypothetical protein